MTALEKALAILGPKQFSELQHLYTAYGFVYSCPEFIWFARPCIEADYNTMLKPEEFERADSWFVELCVSGRGLGLPLKHLPYHLPRIGWQRGLKANAHTRFYNTQSLLKYHAIT